MSALPFVVGQWVRGPAFYGREDALAHALDPKRPAVWFAGLRRVGKTSLLRELERQGAASTHTLPIVWDLQGVDDAQELADSLEDTLLDATEDFERHGIDLDALPRASVEAVLSGLLEAMRPHDLNLLLLIDEADALATVTPPIPRAFWTRLEEESRHRVVLASSLPLCDLPNERRNDLLPERIEAPTWLGPLAPEASRALLSQRHLPEASQPHIDQAAIEGIRRLSGDHPMLLQLLGRRCHEVGDLDIAFAQLVAERTVDHLIAVDLDLLQPSERDLVLNLVEFTGPHLSPASGERLESLGLIKRSSQGNPEAANAFLAHWLQRERRAPSP